jgi:mitochondrial import receptor subunit TOM40
MSFQDFADSLPNVFGTNKVKCESDKVGMDDPAFAQLDPHLNYDNIDQPSEDDQVPAFQRKSLRKPPSFDAFMNPVKSITKKFEHIKGFRFEVGGAPTQNFHMTHSWNLISGPAPQGPMGKGQIGTYNLSCQYISGNIDPFSPVPPKPSMILTGRVDSGGKLDAVLIKPIDDKIQLRVSAMFPNTDMNYAMLHADLDVEGKK